MKNEKPLVTINDECKFAESDWQENWHCEECKTRINIVVFGNIIY